MDKYTQTLLRQYALNRGDSELAHAIADSLLRVRDGAFPDALLMGISHEHGASASVCVDPNLSPLNMLLELNEHGFDNLSDWDEIYLITNGQDCPEIREILAADGIKHLEAVVTAFGGSPEIEDVNGQVVVYTGITLDEDDEDFDWSEFARAIAISLRIADIQQDEDDQIVIYTGLMEMGTGLALYEPEPDDDLED